MVTGGGYRDKVGGHPPHPLGSTHLHRPQRPVGKEHPTGAVPQGHLVRLELEAREALGQRRGVEDVAGTQAAPAALQLRVTRRAQHHQPRLPAPQQPHQLTCHPLPIQTPPHFTAGVNRGPVALVMLRTCCTLVQGHPVVRHWARAQGVEHGGVWMLASHSPPLNTASPISSDPSSRGSFRCSFS